MKRKTIYLLLFVLLKTNGIVIGQTTFPEKYERLYSLSVIWKEMQYNFAFPEKLKSVNLDSLYKEYLPQVELAKDNYDYYKILSSFMAHFNEAHTRISVINRPDDTPPIELTNIKENIIIKNISKKLVKHIPIGSKILKINNKPVLEYLNDSVLPYISASTSHWKFDKAVTEMLYGKPLSSVNLAISTPKGKIHQIDLIRDYYSNGKKEQMADTTIIPPLDIKMINEHIGYVRLSTCVGSKLKEIQQIFDNNLPKLLKSKGIIIDIRGNRGGTDEAWYPIAFHLLPHKEYKNKGQWMCRINISSYKMYGKYYSQMKEYYEGTAMCPLPQQPYSNNIPDSLKINQPVVILSGKYVGSAAEDFLLLMKEQKRGVIVGEPSVGCIGEPMSIPLSHNYNVMLCAKKYVNEDGSQPNATGILPDVEVVQNYHSFILGKDNQLEAAIAILKKAMDK